MFAKRSRLKVRNVFVNLINKGIETIIKETSATSGGFFYHISYFLPFLYPDLCYMNRYHFCGLLGAYKPMQKNSYLFTICQSCFYLFSFNNNIQLSPYGR